ncbi:MAG: hypothetical protein DWQ07_09685 [Chloroflexi bacterium]|nr:MAG: hypothetical protein DWQ07_09685 [Chloroflexota bacterium]MBL1193015.1 hypothetical protein [Chloroflexota bacterium]NOH10308.1 hypothetical protein [Chloroflexota bacterium]
MPASKSVSKLIPLLTITVLLLNLLAPVGIAFAQDADPPPDPPPAEEVVDEEPGEDAEAPAEEPDAEELVVEEPVEEEAPPAEESPEQEEPVEEAPAEDALSEDEAQPQGEEQTADEVTTDEVPEGESTGDDEEVAVEELGTGEEPASDEAGDEETAPEEENPVAEAVQALDKADAVLLDENGEPLSMASQEAAEALAAPDPQFCPAGLSFGDAGCGAAHTNMADAIADALAAAASGISGTIFVESGNFDNSGINDDILVDGFTYGTSLTIQGNANGGGTTTFTTSFLVGTNTPNIFSSLTFNDVTFDAGVVVVDNTGDLSLNNVIANNATGDGIVVDNHNGAVSLDHVTASGTGDDGAEIDNTASSTDAGVTVTNSQFNNNVNDDGLEIDSDGDVTISNVIANGNGEAGVQVETLGTVSISDTNANFNDLIGLYVEDSEQVTLTNVDTISNGLAGADVSAAYGVSIFNSNFNDNGDSSSPVGLGLLIVTGGDVTLDGVSASGNTSDSNTTGADILGVGSVTISNSLFNNNVGSGDVAGLSIQAGGNIALESIQANQNVGTGVGSEVQGAILGNFFSGTNSNVLIKDSSFNGNSGGDHTVGLVVLSDGAITLKNVSASGNTSANGDAIGAELDNGASWGSDVDAQVTVINSQFNNNAGLTDGLGLLVYSQGTIHLWGVTANGNNVDGVDLQIDSSNGGEDTQIYCSFMQGNGEVGILVDGQGGDLKIQSTDTSGNGLNALDIINVGNTILGQTNCDLGQDGKDNHRDSKHVPLDPNDPITIVLDRYPHSVTFPPMNLLECTGAVNSLFFPSELPAELYEGDDFLRALKIRIENCEIPDDGMFTIGFDIPVAEQENEFAVLFWDSSTDSWVEIPGELTADGHYTVSWPTTGIFLLVTR